MTIHDRYAKKIAPHLYLSESSENLPPPFPVDYWCLANLATSTNGRSLWCLKSWQHHHQNIWLQCQSHLRPPFWKLETLWYGRRVFFSDCTTQSTRVSFLRASASPLFVNWKTENEGAGSAYNAGRETPRHRKKRSHHRRSELAKKGNRNKAFRHTTALKRRLYWAIIMLLASFAQFIPRRV